MKTILVILGVVLVVLGATLFATTLVALLDPEAEAELGAGRFVTLAFVALPCCGLLAGGVACFRSVARRAQHRR